MLHALLALASVLLTLASTALAQVSSTAKPDSQGLFRPFIITDSESPYEGLLRRSAHAGLDWYFTSLAIALAPPESLAPLQLHFERALTLLPVAGPLPLRPHNGLRVISDSAQLWQLEVTLESPLAWQCAWVEFPKTAPLQWAYLDDCGRLWRNWGRVAVDSHWSLSDTTDDLMSLRTPDSHDAQAAVFLLALSRWLQTMKPADWLQQAVWRIPDQTGDKHSGYVWLTRADIIKQMVRHNLLNHMQDGLFRTFRHNRHPEGGEWDVQYLMDNIECQAALRALIPVFDQAGHAAFADVLRQYEIELSRGIDGLRSSVASAPLGYRKWARQGEWPLSDAGGTELAFYPHLAGQYWEGLFEAEASVTLQNRWTQMEPHLGAFSDWWRQPFLHLGAGLPPYLARMRHVPGMASDVSPRLQSYVAELTPANSVISDYVVAWRMGRR